MTNDKWKMANGKWKMENGKWKMENKESHLPLDLARDESYFPFVIFHLSLNNPTS